MRHSEHENFVQEINSKGRLTISVLNNYSQCFFVDLAPHSIFVMLPVFSYQGIRLNIFEGLLGIVSVVTY